MVETELVKVRQPSHSRRTSHPSCYPRSKPQGVAIAKGAEITAQVVQNYGALVEIT